MRISTPPAQVATQETTTLAFVENNVVAFPTITSIEYVGTYGVAVTTRVPSNTFSFEDGRSLAVSGVVEMKLAGGDGRARRRLQAGGGASALSSPFALELELSGETVASSPSGFVSTSAAPSVSGWASCFTSLAVAFGLACALW